MDILSLYVYSMSEWSSPSAEEILKENQMISFYHYYKYVACIKLGEWLVIYMNVWGIDFTFMLRFSNWDFGTVLTYVVLFPQKIQLDELLF